MRGHQDPGARLCLGRGPGDAHRPARPMPRCSGSRTTCRSSARQYDSDSLQVQWQSANALRARPQVPGHGPHDVRRPDGRPAWPPRSARTSSTGPEHRLQPQPDREDRTMTIASRKLEPSGCPAIWSRWCRPGPRRAGGAGARRHASAACRSSTRASDVQRRRRCTTSASSCRGWHRRCGGSSTRARPCWWSRSTTRSSGSRSRCSRSTPTCRSSWSRRSTGVDGPITARLQRGGGLDHLLLRRSTTWPQALAEDAERGSLVVCEPVFAVAFTRTVGFVQRRSGMVVEYISATEAPRP